MNDSCRVPLPTSDGNWKESYLVMKKNSSWNRKHHKGVEFLSSSVVRHRKGELSERIANCVRSIK